MKISDYDMIDEEGGLLNDFQDEKVWITIIEKKLNQNLFILFYFQINKILYSPSRYQKNEKIKIPLYRQPKTYLIIFIVVVILLAILVPLAILLGNPDTLIRTVKK